MPRKPDNARVFGIDPGPDPGMVMLWVKDRKLFEAYIPSSLEDGLMAADIVTCEKFLISNATIHRTRAGSIETIAMIEQVKAWCADHSVLALSFPAGVVKPWSSDARLRSWGLYKVPSGHHRDAARHALYAAVKYTQLPVRPKQDPVEVFVR